MFCGWLVPVLGGSDFFFVRINSFNSLLQNVRIGLVLVCCHFWKHSMSWSNLLKKGMFSFVILCQLWKYVKLISSWCVLILQLFINRNIFKSFVILLATVLSPSPNIDIETFAFCKAGHSYQTHIFNALPWFQLIPTLWRWHSVLTPRKAMLWRHYYTLELRLYPWFLRHNALPREPSPYSHDVFGPLEKHRKYQGTIRSKNYWAIVRGT